MEFICYPKCSTCQKARQYLIDNNVNFKIRDIKLDTPTKEEILNWVNKYNIDIAKLYNTSGILYKEYDIKNKKIGMSIGDQAKLLSSNGMLIKRPILVSDDFIIIGFKESEYKAKAVK